MSNPHACPDCGAEPSGELLGFPVIVHAKGCSRCLPPLKKDDVIWLLGRLPDAKRFLCCGCGATWNKPGEGVHSPDCPGNPLTN